MSDELRKAARELLDAMDNGIPYRERDKRQEALRAALAEPEPKKCDCTGFGHNPACPVSLSNLAATISRRHDATEPSREPTQEQVQAWVKEAGCTRNHDLFRFAAIVWTAGHKAGSGT